MNDRILVHAVAGALLLSGCGIVYNYDDDELFEGPSSSSSGGSTATSGGGGDAGGGGGSHPAGDVSIASFSASKQEVYVGREVKISWDARNASSCTLNPMIGPVPSKGSRRVEPGWPGSTFSLTCEGHGGPVSAETSVKVIGVEQVTAGYDFTCALLDNGKVKCWGGNGSGQLGLGDTTKRGSKPTDMGDALPFVDLGAGVTVKELTSASAHTCARLATDDIKCWGYSVFGELGLGDMNSRGDQDNEMGADLDAVDLGPSVKALQVRAGGHHSCAVLHDSSVKCWGKGQYGALGLDTTANHGDAVGTMGAALLVANLGTGIQAADVSSGAGHTCFLDAAAAPPTKVRCWGQASLGQLGTGQTTNDIGDGAPSAEMGSGLAAVSLGASFVPVSVTAGNQLTCALSTAGTAKCWGRNQFGELGQGDTNNRDAAGEMGDLLLPIALGAGRTVRQIAAFQHVCAILDNHGLKCWGEGTFGKLGQGKKDNIGSGANQMGDDLIEIDLGSGRYARSIALGANHMCAVLDTHALKCWGRNDLGQLGLGEGDDRGDEPDEMGNLLPAVDVGL